ncbi:hypothetical protein M408DRAFT_28877 [Serendipita vermifera MAFF 305830]|uniref:CxC5 like cysteine cluster associated with KDZ domain-containing protein n=1 Tax=Serendipita vermifera MAFF 305830 TaxID=933852 RepID=A0A0C2WY50_SERVB|nr:hypothetical protein M408DRAFT_28877 [Serendipita vermifera MAFF 305830]
MPELTKIFEALQGSPALQTSFTTDQFFLFIDLCCHLRPELDLTSSYNRQLPPLRLPQNVCKFLALAVFSSDDQETISIINDAWRALSRVIWQTSERLAPASALDMFLLHGPALKIAWKIIGPPTVTCTYSECPYFRRDLTNRKQYPATLFTRDHGPIPVFPSNLYCEGCHTTYHPNYYIHSNATARTYYNETVPKVVQVSQRNFFEETLCEQFAVMMTMAWNSATNCARIFNLSTGDYTRERQKLIGWKAMQMEMEHVWNGFFLHGLMLESFRSQTRLTFPNSDTHHFERYSEALILRNESYRGVARPMWNHVCDLCSKVVIRDGVAVLIRAVVVDGVTIGHPCCGVHDCKEPLPSESTPHGKPRYCLTHQNIENKCAITTCNQLAVAPHKTCAQAECRGVENKYTSTGNAMFQLKSRLKRNRERLTGKKTIAPFHGAAAAALDAALLAASASTLRIRLQMVELFVDT